MRIVTRVVFLLVATLSCFALQARMMNSEDRVNQAQALEAAKAMESAEALKAALATKPELPMFLAGQVKPPHPNLNDWGCAQPFPRARANEAQAAHAKCVAWCNLHVGKNSKTNCANQDCGSCGATQG